MSYRSYLAVIVTVATSCAAQSQQRGGGDPATSRLLLTRVLGAARASGSIAYRGRCDFHEFYPDFPKLRGLSDYSGAPVEVLQKMFEPDPQMRVTRDARGGKIRMVERDAPLDLLNVRIQHISFNFTAQGPKANRFTGPTIALHIILSSPEVQAFKTEYDIGPSDEGGFGWPGDAYPGQAAMSGELRDVTLMEALDHVLDTFPGFWLYEACRSDVGQRLAYFYFFQNASPPRR